MRATVRGGDAVQRGLLVVHIKADLRLRILDVPVHIHHAGGLWKILDLPGDLDLAVVSGP